MSAIALALAQMGHDVSGSDIREGSVLARLRAAGIEVAIGHDPAAVVDADAVTASPAIPADNVEVAAAKARDEVFMTRAEMLASICAVAPTIGVAGTHGKTTTTSLLVRMFDRAGRRPNFVVGGEIRELDTNARWTGSDWTIVEADESDGTHLALPLYATVLTNVDVDHLDHYGDFAGIVDSFSRYLKGIEGPRVVCSDDETILEILSGLKKNNSVVTYGGSSASSYRYHDVRADRGLTHFEVSHAGTTVGFTTALRGRHNVANITGAFAMAVECGIAADLAAEAVHDFGGVGRRFDIRGTVDGITLVDDYAHLPREIDAVLTAARTSGDGWRRIVAVFQPNRYNRMSEISDEYADAFRSADLIVLTDIYSSGTAKIEGVTGQLVVDAVLSRHPEADVMWVPVRDRLAERVCEVLESGDVCISMGCGDIESLPEEILELKRSVGAS